MSILWNRFSRSEQWRLEWGCRSCISVAFVAFLYLYSPTKHHLTRYGTASTSFATVVTSFLKDVTIGATITNGWACLLGAFIATTLSWIYFIIVRKYYVDSVPLLLTLVSILIGTFVLQYWETVPITKKFSVGMIPIYLINYRNEHNPSFFIWGMFLAVLIGFGCALIGCVVPFPVRLASTELRERIEYYSVAISSLITDQAQCWLDTYKTGKNGSHLRFSSYRTATQSNNNINRVEVNVRDTREASNSVSSDYIATPNRYIRKTFSPVGVSLHIDGSITVEGTESQDANSVMYAENLHWRKLRLLLTTIGAFKSSGSFHSDPRRKYNTRYLRMELVNYLQETLPYLQSRNLETGFGFTRRVGNRCAKFISLIQHILLIVTKLEGHIESMEKNRKYHYLFEAFFSRPNLYYALSLYAQSIVDVIMSVSAVLVEQSVFDDQLLTPGNEGFRAVAAAAKLIRARKYFDAEYLKARRDLFYPQTVPEPNAEQEQENDDIDPPPPPETTYASSSAPQDEHSEDAISQPAVPPSMRLLQRGSNHQQQKAALRADTKAMLDVNNIIFLLDTLSRLLLEFWSAEDLVQMSEHHLVCSSFPQMEFGDSEREQVNANRSTETPIRRNLRKFANGAHRFVWELFPTNQAHLIPQRHVDYPQQRCWVLTDTIKQRLAMAAKVSVGMTIGAFYGIIANRPYPHLASMTIAFLAGGTVTGINVMTCINRAAGTAVACVYAIMVAYIANYLNNDWERDLFVGFAVVLLQLPATYVRSYPLYSYSGTVMGFTCAMILLARNISTEYAINRIIDTYVGVALFLVIEMAFAARFTEDELLGDMKRVFTGVQDRFINMHRNFQFFKATEDSVTEVRARIRGGTLTPFEVDEEMKRIETLREDIKIRKALEVESIQALIRRQIQLGPFYRTEPAIWRPVVFPTSLLEESVALQKQAADSIQIMIWAVMTCDGTFDGRAECLITNLDSKIKQKAAAKGVQDTEVASANEPLAARNSTGTHSLTSTPRPPSISILPEFKSLLLPLEPHFIDVERFVSEVLLLLANAMEHISDWKPALRELRSSIDIPCLTPPVPSAYSRRRRPTDERAVERAGNMLTQLRTVGESRHNYHTRDARGDMPNNTYGRLSNVLNATELGSLHDKYRRLVLDLQQGLATEGSRRPTMEHATGPTRIISNREVVIVNTLITSTQQLIEALHGLTDVVSRMQAHRDIHVTQDGKRL